MLAWGHGLREGMCQVISPGCHCGQPSPLPGGCQALHALQDRQATVLLTLPSLQCTQALQGISKWSGAHALARAVQLNNSGWDCKVLASSSAAVCISNLQ